MGWVNCFFRIDKNQKSLEKALISRNEVKTFAESLWKEAGCPSNQDRHFWLQACKRFATEF